MVKNLFLRDLKPKKRIKAINCLKSMINSQKKQINESEKLKVIEKVLDLADKALGAIKDE
jgi:hypothetical protein